MNENLRELTWAFFKWLCAAIAFVSGLIILFFTLQFRGLSRIKENMIMSSKQYPPPVKTYKNKFQVGRFVIPVQDDMRCEERHYGEGHGSLICHDAAEHRYIYSVEQNVAAGNVCKAVSEVIANKSYVSPSGYPIFIALRSTGALRHQFIFSRYDSENISVSARSYPHITSSLVQICKINHLNDYFSANAIRNQWDDDYISALIHANDNNS